MYKCNECGFLFDTPKTIYETHGFRDGRYEEWKVCPSCGDTNYGSFCEDYDEEDEMEEEQENDR